MKSTEGVAPEPRREGWFVSAKTAVQTALFGYDFFISYRHGDASACAQSLHSALTREGFDCFLDVHHYAAGHNLPWMQSQALKHSTKLLVVVSPRAHVSPEKGIDWLLAEVHEFKHLAKRRGARPTIVPLGTPRTLSVEEFPGSKLLAEIPTPTAHDICIFDNAVERNTEVAPATIAKLRNDFREFRRRRVRHIAAWSALVATCCAAAFGVLSGRNEAAARRTAKLGEAFRLLDRGQERMEGVTVADSQALYSQSAKLFQDLGRDPLMVLHHEFAGRLRQLRAKVIAESGSETSYLKLSADGAWVLVVYDYQAPNGSPEMKDILNWPAFRVFHIPQQKCTLTQTLASAIGKLIYERADVVAFEPPHHVIVRTGVSGESERFSRVSLVNGAKAKVKYAVTEEGLGSALPALVTTKTENPVEARLKSLLVPEQLFVTDPNDGIDREYGPRLVEKTYVEASDRRTAIVGTYEGRLMLVDLATGLSRGEIKTDTVYAAAYRPDGSRGYFCDQRNLWEIETSGWPGVDELHVPLHKSSDRPGSDEKVLAAALAKDASVIALATTQRLLCWHVQQQKWIEWRQPRPIKVAAALQVDERRSRIDFVAGDDGTILSADYSNPSSRLDAIPRPGGAEPTVAWMDTIEPAVWLIGTRCTNRTTHVHAVPLPGGNAKAVDLQVAMPSDEKSRDADDVRRCHAIAKSGSTITLFHGDENSSDDGRDVLAEQMLQISLDAGTPPVSRVLFESKRHDNGPDNLWTCTQVTSVFPNSRPGSLLVRTDFHGVYTIGRDGLMEKALNGLFVMEHMDGDQSYVLGLDVKKSGVWLEIRHGGTGTTLRSQLPWSFPDSPDVATMALGGRQALLASASGNVLFFDVSGKARPISGKE